MVWTDKGSIISTFILSVLSMVFSLLGIYYSDSLKYKEQGSESVNK